MKKAIYKIFVFFAFAVGIMVSHASESFASEVTSISENSVIYECMSENAEAKYYEYTFDLEAYVTVGFCGENASGAQWDLRLLDEKQEELLSYTCIEGEFSTPKLNFAPGTKVYIEVSLKGAPQSQESLRYSLWVTGENADDWETETRKGEADKWKERIGGADTLSVKARYGTLWNADDNDVYKLEVAKTGIVTLQFYPDYEAEQIGWGYDIEVYTKSGKKAMTYKQIKTNVQKRFWAKKGSYYAVIKASWPKSAPSASGKYSVAAVCRANKVAGMKGKKLSYHRKKGILEWEEERNADGYEVRIYKNKKFKKGYEKSYLTIDNSYKLPRRFRKGTYYIRVRAYCETVTGNKIYGKFSKAVKISKRKQKKDN